MISRRALFAGAAGAVVAASAPGRAMAPRDIGWVSDSLMRHSLPYYGVDIARAPDQTAFWTVRDGKSYMWTNSGKRWVPL